nr:flagellar biosynthesis repressor FlbT [Acuticoccus kandeliae]
MSAPTRRRRASEGEGRGGPMRPMHLSLRAGERLFINGAVVRVDRKVTIELLNDATFLLENHVLQVEDTTTPLRQLYFAVQAMLMDPQNAAASRTLFETMAVDVRDALTTARLREGLEDAISQVANERPFHALKRLRSLFAEEAALLEIPEEIERPRREGAGARQAKAARLPCAKDPGAALAEEAEPIPVAPDQRGEARPAGRPTLLN